MSFPSVKLVPARVSVKRGGGLGESLGRFLLIGVVASVSALGLTSPAQASTVPSAPTSISVTRGNASLSVHWDVPTSNGGSAISGYALTATAVSSSGTLTRFTRTVTGSTYSALISGLKNGTSYSVRMTATNAVGLSDQSAAVTGVPSTISPAAPAAPSISAVSTATPGTLSISYRSGSANGSNILWYSFSIDGGASWRQTNANPIAIQNLANGTSYIFKLRAGNYIGTGDSVSRVLKPVGLPITIAFAPSAQAIGTMSPALEATAYNGTTAVGTTSPSGTQVTIASLTPTICSVFYSYDDYKYHSGALNPGICKLKASTAGLGTYQAYSVTKSVRITQGTLTLSISNLNPMQVGGTDQAISVVSAAGAVVLTSTTPTVCSIVSSTYLHAIKAGTCVVRATNSGDTKYTAATPVTRSVLITGASPTPTPTASSTATASVSATPTASSSVSPSATPAPSISTSPSAGPTASASSSASASVSPSPAASWAGSPCPSPASASQVPVDWGSVNGYSIGFRSILTNANLNGAYLSGAFLKQANMTSATLYAANLSAATVNDAVISDADLSCADLSATDLSYSDLSHSNFAKSNLSGANLSGANLSGANLSGANLSGANLMGVLASGIIGTPAALPDGWVCTGGYLLGPWARLENADLSAVDLTGVSDLSYANLSGVNLSGVNLSGVNLFRIHARRVSGTLAGLPMGWRLVGGYMVGPSAWLDFADFSGADLSGASLAGAHLEGAFFDGATLAGADLSGADLYGAHLFNADVSGANLVSATLTAAITGGLIGVPYLPRGWSLTDGTLVQK
jgi:uncharacterized protein YjbI with pentapeptide repeats